MPPKTTPKGQKKSATVGAAKGASSKAQGGKSASSVGSKISGRQVNAGKVKQKAPKKSANQPTLTGPVKSKIKWTEQDRAAVKIQSVVRGYLGRHLLQKKKEERDKYNALIEQIEKEAWLEMVRKEREELAKKQQKEDEERKRKAAERKRQQVILEASFDGNRNLITQILNEAARSDKETNSASSASILDFVIKNHHKRLINCEDANGNTPLSEAAAGGDSDTVKYLIQKGANVNTKGAFGRTPLFRASFGGHTEVVEVLLENGADPRIYDNEGNTPDQIAAVSGITEIIKHWDVAETDRLLLLIERKKEEMDKQAKDYTKAETERIENAIASVQEEHEVNQKQLRKAYEELNKRIFEHDKCNIVGGSKAEITLTMVHDAEAELLRYQQNEKEAREKLAQLRLSLREQRGVDDLSSDPVVKHGMICHIRELDDVLIRDVGDKIKNDGRWPLLIDTSTQACTFLRYRDTNYINALSPPDMETETLRKALLGAVRYGKPFVLDMMEVDMIDVFHQRLESISRSLYTDIVSKEILKNERYLCLVKPEDGEEYSKTSFMDSRLEKFKFVLITKIWSPPEEWLQTFYPIRIVAASR